MNMFNWMLVQWTSKLCPFHISKKKIGVQVHFNKKCRSVKQRHRITAVDSIKHCGSVISHENVRTGYLAIKVLHSRSTSLFAETIWVILEVREGGMLGLTQQLSQMGTGAMETDGAPSTDRMLPNPFGSPTKIEGKLQKKLCTDLYDQTG